MPTFRMLCLANSSKRGGRCIAGLRTDNQAWIRPISNSSDGTLSLEHYQLGEDIEPQLLDVLEIEFSTPIPQPHQPENWLISEANWKLHLRFVEDLDLHQKKLLSNYVHQAILKESLIFGDQNNCIPYQSIFNHPLGTSLVLIRPQNLVFSVTKSEDKCKIRANFNLDDVHYSLPLTDPSFKGKLATFSSGNYSFHKLPFIPNNPKNLFLTISLGLPYKQECYKLVAAVIYF